MNYSFEGDLGEAVAALGFVSGITATVKTDAYIAKALDYTHDRMIEELDRYIDTIAQASPQMLHHVYEWPTGWNSNGGNKARGGSPDWRETVGKPEYRLWRHTLVGRGAKKTAGFTFEPSTRPSPVNPILKEKGVKENVHIFVWKAPVMEAGTHLQVTARLARTLAYVNKEGEVAFAKTTNTGVAGGGQTTGKFTLTYLTWWSSAAGPFFDREIAPLLQRNIDPNGALAKAAKKIGTRTRNKSLAMNVKQFDQAFKEAEEWVEKKARKDYIEGPGGARERRDNLYG